jgi:hypothetical protein
VVSICLNCPHLVRNVDVSRFRSNLNVLLMVVFVLNVESFFLHLVHMTDEAKLLGKSLAKDQINYTPTLFEFVFSISPKHCNIWI